MAWDLNCDLGEGEPLARTRALMRWVTSANVACGGHAGTADSMASCVQLAGRFGVRLGAHPGPWSRSDFGRSAVRCTPDALELLLLQQVGALETLARSERVRLHHVKLHGALYHATESDAALARAYLQTVQRWWPHCRIYALSGGRVAQLARQSFPEVQLWEEAFADRAYRDDGTLVPRGDPGAVLRSLGDTLAQARSLVEAGRVRTAGGQERPVRARTLCLHSDGPGVLARLRAVARLIARAEGRG